MTDQEYNDKRAQLATLKRYAGKLQRRLWKQEVRREEGYVHA